MAHIIGDFEQMDRSVPPPFIQFTQTLRVYGDGTIERDSCWDAFSAQQHTIYLLLLQSAQTFPHASIRTWELVRYLYANRYHEMDDPAHAVQQHIYTMRDKLGKQGKNIIVGSRSKGYKLILPNQCSFVPLKYLQQFLYILTGR